jgi:transposase
MDEETENKARGLLLKGFNKQETARLLGLKEEEIESVFLPQDDLQGSSSALYTELQKDLSKLVLTEMNKENRDSNVILNAIRMTADLQEKKLNMSTGRVTPTKVSKDFIYNRDEEIMELKKNGMSEEEIAKKFGVGKLSVRYALDRLQLNLPLELRDLNPSIISETIGLAREDRLKVLQDAFEYKWTRKEVREIVNQIKNTR